MNAMPAVGGVASVLGIKCVNLFTRACVILLLGRGPVMCSGTPLVEQKESRVTSGCLYRGK